jgi:hypothetical protein
MEILSRDVPRVL